MKAVGLLGSFGKAIKRKKKTHRGLLRKDADNTKRMELVADQRADGPQQPPLGPPGVRLGFTHLTRTGTHLCALRGNPFPSHVPYNSMWASKQ